MARIVCDCGYQTELSEFLAKGGIYCTRCGADLTGLVNQADHQKQPRGRHPFSRDPRAPRLVPVTVWIDRRTQPWSVFAILGLLFSVFCVPLGIIFSILGLTECYRKKYKGEWMAMLGLAVSVHYTILVVVFTTLDLWR